MFEELDEYMRSVTSPEYSDLIQLACTTLENAGITSLTDSLENILTTLNIKPTLVVLNDIETLLKNTYEELINEFGVFINDETTLKVMIAILSGLLAVENYDDTATIEDLCGSDGDTEEKLMRILELLTPMNWGDFCTCIESVNPMLIDKIRELLPDDEETVRIGEDEQYILTRTRSLLAVYENLWILDEVDSGLTVGSKPETYLELFSQRFSEHFPSPVIGRVDHEKLAANYLGYLMISNLSDEQLVEFATQHIEDTIDDVNIVSPVSLRISAVLDAIGFNGA